MDWRVAVSRQFSGGRRSTAAASVRVSPGGRVMRMLSGFRSACTRPHACMASRATCPETRLKISMISWASFALQPVGDLLQRVSNWLARCLRRMRKALQERASSPMEVCPALRDALPAALLVHKLPLGTIPARPVVCVRAGNSPARAGINRWDSHQQLLRDLAQRRQPRALRRGRSRHQVVQQAAMQPIQHLLGPKSFLLGVK